MSGSSRDRRTLRRLIQRIVAEVTQQEPAVLPQHELRGTVPSNRWAALKNIGIAVAFPLLGFAVKEATGAPPELVALAALIGATIIAWSTLGSESVKQRLANSSRTIRLLVCALAVVLVLVFTSIIWVMTGRSVSLKIAGYPKFSRTEKVSGVAGAVLCPSCVDELDLDEDGVLYASAIGRGFIEMSLSSTPTIELLNPTPGLITLPQDNDRARPLATDVVSVVTDGEGAKVGLRGTLVNGKMTVTHLVIPEDFPSGRTIKVRERLGVYRFDVGAREEYVITVAGRTFRVKLGGVKEAPEPGGARTVFTYTFHIKES